MAWHSPNCQPAAMLDRIDQHLQPNLKALNLRAMRSEVLAANIANADTPNYKARDFDFRAAMAGVMSAARLGMQRTSPSHIEQRGASPGMPQLQFRAPVQPSIDGNTVELDAEISRFSDNAIRYQAALTFMNSRINGLRTALTGQ